MLSVKEKVLKYLKAAYVYEEARKAMSIVDDGGVSVIYYKEEVESIRFLFNYHRNNLKDAEDNLRTALYLGIAGGKQIQVTEFGFALQDGENRLDEDSAMEYIEKRFKLYGAKQDFIADYESETAYNKFMKFFFGPYAEYVTPKEQTPVVSEEAKEAPVDKAAESAVKEKVPVNCLKNKKYIIITDRNDLKREDICNKLKAIFPDAQFFENNTENDLLNCISCHTKEMRANPEEWLLVADSKITHYEYGMLKLQWSYFMFRRISMYLPIDIDLDAIIVSSEDVDDYLVRSNYPCYLGSVKYKYRATMPKDYEKLFFVKQ